MATGDVRLTRPEISKLVYNWIGVDGGYLGRFGYASHDRFWLETCGVVVETSAFPGTTRQCFEETLFNANAWEQASVLRAILDEYLPDDRDRHRPMFRSPKLHAEILQWLARLEMGQPAITISLAPVSEVVRRALDDADVLIGTSGPQSAIDRVHTAFHGYLHELASEAAVSDLPDRPTMNQLLKAIRRSHPAFSNLGVNADEVSRILQSMATILDAFDPIRNRASVAHANPRLLGEAEAALVINSARTLLGYLEAKRRGWLGTQEPS